MSVQVQYMTAILLSSSRLGCKGRRRRQGHHGLAGALLMRYPSTDSLTYRTRTRMLSTLWKTAPHCNLAERCICKPCPRTKRVRRGVPALQSTDLSRRRIAGTGVMGDSTSLRKFQATRVKGNNPGRIRYCTRSRLAGTSTATSEKAFINNKPYTADSFHAVSTDGASYSLTQRPPCENPYKHQGLKVRQHRNTHMRIHRQVALRPDLLHALAVASLARPTRGGKCLGRLLVVR